jgi:phenylpropionate dioxygenase-like ring-hydroxylating dioxygenase large terminal subunit
VKQQDVDNLRALMEFEAARQAPPDGFPALPDLPGGRYTDPRFYELEKQHLWRKSWLLAAHIDEVPDPGCFLLWENAGQPVVIVHADSGAINAFYNTCSHRGAPVVTDASGKRDRLTCKYHGWSYTHDGELVAIRDPEDFNDLDFSCRSLRSIRCERFGNLIFVNFDEQAPSLNDWLGPVADELEEFQFGKCRLTGRHIFDLNCNWKIAMEANTEVYHVRSIHPKTVAVSLDDRRNVNTFYPNGHGRMVAPGRESTEGMRAASMSAPGLTEITTVGEIGRTCTQSYGLFPNWVSPLNHLLLPPLLFWPTGINTCRLETWTMVHDWGDGEKPPIGDMWTTPDGSELGAVLQEDTQFGHWIQKSVESYGFRGVPLSYQEARIYHWNQWADRIIGIDNIPAELRVAQVMGDEWLHPNDPRLEQIESQQASAG